MKTIEQKRNRKPNRSADELSKEWKTKQLKALRRAIKQKDSWLGDNLSDKDVETLFFKRELRWDEEFIRIVNFDYGRKIIREYNLKIVNLVNLAQGER